MVAHLNNYGGMPQERRPEEEWAARVVAHELGVSVRIHDDGSRGEMHDLEAYLPDGGVAAVEVTAAHDPPLAELTSIVDRTVELPELAWSWNVMLLPSVRYRALQAALPNVLGDLEKRNIDDVRADTDEEMGILGIDWAWRSHGGLAGAVYIHVRPPARRTGGFISGDTLPMVEWLDHFLSTDRISTKRRKLRASGADERHIFVVLPLPTGDVDHRVWHPLWEESIDLPPRPPDLPEPLTHVWIATNFGRGAGLRWSPKENWTTFDKLIKG